MKIDLEKRMRHLQKYIGLGEKLQGIVDEPGLSKFIDESMSFLNDLLSNCQERLEFEKKSARQYKEADEKLAKAEEMRQEAIRDLANIYNWSEEKAEKYLERKTYPRLEAISNYAKGIKNRIHAYMIRPFSKESHDTLIDISNTYFEIARNKLEVAKTRKETKQIEKETKQIEKQTKGKQGKYFQSCHKREFAEARFADMIRDTGIKIDDNAMYQIIEQPEIMCYLYLEAIKKKYAPEL